MKVTFFILVLLGLTACGTKPHEPQVPTSVATPPIISARLLAEMVGELTIENECLRINDYLLVWPPDFTVDIKEDMVEIRDEFTGEKIVWRSGETVQVGGGEVSYPSLDEQVRQRTPAHCSKGGAGAFWLVGDIVIPATVTPAAK
ncbi:MAG TPA: hypothetical protein PLR07_06575 [Promineifilum sp.]|jgi:hypothetical protein|nr:hypothetical protein [Promineifilum sp.]HRO91671.1 hypothetical protein [Promineifilum sp.]